MIVYPKKWRQDYSKYADDTGSRDISIEEFVDTLKWMLEELDIRNLAYSGGIDSTVMLDILTHQYQASTYTMASRNDHPDALFSKIGSLIYETSHHAIITEINSNGNVYETFFESLPDGVTSIICCDGIDEFMCGYYDHQVDAEEKYRHYLGRLTPDHLEVLDSESGDTEVYLPYLDERMIELYTSIPLSAKVDEAHRKIFMRDVAYSLGIDETIINRNKYGFCDAFLNKDK